MIKAKGTEFGMHDVEMICVRGDVRVTSYNLYKSSHTEVKEVRGLGHVTCF